MLEELSVEDLQGKVSQF